MGNTYWRDMYGPRSNDFIEGVIAGITAYAVWKDGKEYAVGIMEQPLEDVIKEVKEQLEYEEKKV